MSDGSVVESYRRVLLGEYEGSKPRRFSWPEWQVMFPPCPHQVSGGTGECSFVYGEEYGCSNGPYGTDMVFVNPAWERASGECGYSCPSVNAYLSDIVGCTGDGKCPCWILYELRLGGPMEDIARDVVRKGGGYHVVEVVASLRERAVVSLVSGKQRLFRYRCTLLGNAIRRLASEE